MQNQSHKYFKISDLNIPHFDYEEYGINGVGNKCLPIISMDKYIDHSLDDTLHIECCKGLAISNNYKMGMVYGAMPPEESVRFDGKNCWTVMLNQLEQYDPTGKHRVAIEEIINTVTKEDIAALKPGDTVLLTGKMLTGRDAAHKKMTEMLAIPWA